MLALQTCTIHIQKCINKKNYEIYLMSFKNKDVRTAIKLLGGNRFILLFNFTLYQANLFLESNGVDVEML